MYDDKSSVTSAVISHLMILVNCLQKSAFLMHFNNVAYRYDLPKSSKTF